MKDKIKKVKNNIISWMEDILFICSFFIFNIAMFNIGVVAGLISLSVNVFILACAVSGVKLKGGIKRK